MDLHVDTFNYEGSKKVLAHGSIWLFLWIRTQFNCKLPYWKWEFLLCSHLCIHILLVTGILETKSFWKASNMAKHHPDLIMCRKQPGIAIGRLCEKDDGKCVICDSLVHPCTLVRICDECNYGSFQGRCVICGGVGISDAYYCKECTQLERDRDGCPKIVNLGSAKTDLFYERKKYGFKKRW